ncbi:MAG: iron-containing alcohol dehydrogenase [Bacilli bacterium]|nr:iron-containing alcohol dehydrogenase [Bacilli bacterium]
MNPFRTFGCRVYQNILFVASSFLDFSEPELFEGVGSVKEVASLLGKKNKIKPMVVTDPGIVSLGLEKGLIAALEEAKIPYTMFDKVCPNPTFDVVEEAVAAYKKENCDCLISLGGGSSIDTAKSVGARISNPRKSLSELKGVLKVSKRPPYSIAIPTTAGTGSETTVAAVVVNPKTKDKFSISDPKLIPDAAILDNSLLSGLPQKIISSTGMDALTHAVESYIGRSSTKKTKKYALESIALIKDNLYEFYLDKNNEKAREAMQKASYLAGVSFTRAYVGYVHALAHALGGYYNTPHGLANAVILPHCLKAYGSKAYKRLAEISDYIGLTKTDVGEKEKSEAFIAWIEEMNKKMDIPVSFDHLIKEEDLEGLAKHADKEANPLYPVPKEFDANELKQILLEVSPL